MRSLAIAAVVVGCHSATPVAPALDPPPATGVIAPRGVKVVKIEAHAAPAKQRWLATFEPDAGTPLATANAQTIAFGSPSAWLRARPSAAPVRSR